jgi:dienelactone hydrolase
VTSLLRRVAQVLLLLLAASAGAHERVVFPSLDPPSGPPVMLVGHWFAAGGLDTPGPAVALFHGCSGPYEREGGPLDHRTRDYIVWLHARAFHVLVVDSLTPRGEKETCTQRTGKRRVTQTQRRRDALAAVEWLAQRPEVDAKRIGLLGWSSGGSTVLAATNLRHPDVAAAPNRPAFAVAFYPGCQAELERGYEPATQVLMLVGEADDWTAPGPCHRLAEAAHSTDPAVPAVALEGYAGAYHGFDSTQPVRVRKDVPNGVHPGQGVHVGGNAEALRRSRERLTEFLARF